MSIIKTKSRGINLADNFAFTGTVSGAGTEIEVDQWDLPNHFDDGHQAVALITTWQRASATTSAKIGTGLTMDVNGIFSFPRTGVWTIHLESMYHGMNANDTAMGITIHGSTDDFSSDVTIGTSHTSCNYITGAGTTQYVNASCNVIFNCSNITTHKVRFKTNSVDTASSPSAIDVTGVAGNIHTGVLFQRVGDAQ